MSRIRVAVIFGGVSSEHDVSLVSATHVIQNLSSEKYDITCIGITKKGRWLFYPGDIKLIATGEWEAHPDCTPAILSPDPIHKGFIKTQDDGTASIYKVDVIFPVLHGKNGEDGTIQGLFNLAKIPFVGCDTLASAACMDKAVTHVMLDAAGIRTAKFEAVNRCDSSSLDKRCEEIAKKLSYPMFVKPANAGSSIGISKASTFEELKNAIKYAFTHDKKVVVEELIVGKEVECAVMGNDILSSSKIIASVIGEIAPCNDFYDYDAKYILGTTNLFIPARIDDEISDKIRAEAIKAYNAMGCSGLSRVDFFLTEDNEIILNEINTLPGFTPISMYPKLMNEIGISYSELLDRLINLAFERADVIYE